MTMIDVKNLSFRYGADYIFENISFQLDSGWKLGLVGRNGRGKTTFLNLLQGKYEYQGTITTKERFLYFPYNIEDRELMTINIIEDIYPDYEYWRLQKECNLLSLDEEVLYRSFNSLSGGEQTKVLLATLFMQEDAYVLIDEPTNHLDVESRELVSEYLQKKKNFILVCHDRSFMDGCVDHIMAINKNSIDIQSGNFSSWYENKQRKDNQEIVANQRLQKEIVSLNEATKRSKQWSDKVEKTKNGTRVAGLRPDKGHIGHMAAKMMQKAKNTERRREKSIQEKKELLKDIEEVEDLKIPALQYKKNQYLYFQNVSLFYPNKTICTDVSFTISKGERIALTGQNGSGKSTILKLITGESISYSGEVKIPEDLIISYVPQNIDTLSGDVSEHINKAKVDESLCKTILRKMDFSRQLFSVPMERYSSGQKKKVLIACALSKPAHLYVFDEPLNYIDIFSRIQIENVLKGSEATIIFVEHDKTFVNSIMTKSIAL
ncbi:MAG: ribosomal protection-like ABC-F family protein [Coprobacillaceae bacterium]